MKSACSRKTMLLVLALACISVSVHATNTTKITLRTLFVDGCSINGASIGCPPGLTAVASDSDSQSGEGLPKLTNPWLSQPAFADLTESSTQVVCNFIDIQTANASSAALIEKYGQVMGGNQGTTDLNCQDVWYLNKSFVAGPHRVNECGAWYSVTLQFNPPGSKYAFKSQTWVLDSVNTVTVTNSYNGNIAFYYNCKAFFDIAANLATFFICSLISVCYFLWVRSKYPEIIAMERETNFVGFTEVPPRFNDGCFASDAEKNGFKGTDDEYAALMSEVKSLTFHKWFRLQVFFHPILAVIYAPRRDGYNSTRRGLVLSISYGCGLLVNCLSFKSLSNGMNPIAAAVVSQLIAMVVGLFMEKPLTFLIKCSGRCTGCLATVAQCLTSPMIFCLSVLPIVMLIVYGIRLGEQGIFGPLVLSWVASISTAFVSAIIVPTIMFVLPKFGNAEVVIRTINEIYREYEISEDRQAKIPVVKELLGERLTTMLEQQMGVGEKGSGKPLSVIEMAPPGAETAKVTPMPQGMTFSPPGGAAQLGMTLSPPGGLSQLGGK